MLSPGVAWQRLLRMQEVLVDQPELARAVRRLSLHDQLLLTLELLEEPDPPPELPANVIRFRPRVRA